MSDSDDLPIGFRPDSYGFHELLDRVHLISELYDAKIVSHPSAKHAAIRRLILRISRDLGRLYQEVGAIHLAD